MSIRIAVVGAGSIGRKHCNLVRANTRTQLAAVIDPHSKRDGFGAPGYRSLEEALAAESLDGIIVASPNTTHVELAMLAVGRGIPVLVEKPVSDDSAAAVRLIEAGRAAAVPILVGHHRRHSDLVAMARLIVAEGTLGRIVAVTGSAMFYKEDEYFDAEWRRVKGGGPILVNLIHDIDSLRSICGDILEVQAMPSSATRGFEVEDTAAITMRFASGALGTFLLSDVAASTMSWEQTSGEGDGFAHDPHNNCYVIVGTEGSLEVPTMRLRRFAGQRSWRIPLEQSVLPATRNDPLSAQLEHFCDVIQRGVAPIVSGEEATETLRVVEAIIRSADSGRLEAVASQREA